METFEYNIKLAAAGIVKTSHMLQWEMAKDGRHAILSLSLSLPLSLSLFLFF